MTAYKGSLVVIKAGDGEVSEDFSVIGGLRLSRLILQNRPLESSNIEAGVWRHLLPGSGIRSLHMSGLGMFTDANSEEMVRSHAFAGTSANYQFVFGNADIVSGAFCLTHYERIGDFEEEELYKLTLENSGNITFQAA